MSSIDDINRLKGQLLTSGLSQKDSVLFQIINQLIGIVQKSLNQSSGGSSGGGGGSSVTNYITNPTTFLSSSDGSNDSDIDIVIPGPKGDRGELGIPGIPGIDGIDGMDGVPGPQGIPGNNGTIGRDGLSIIGLDGIDGNDGFPIPGVNGINGTNGTIGSNGSNGPPGLDGNDGDDRIWFPPGITIPNYRSYVYQLAGGGQSIPNNTTTAMTWDTALYQAGGLFWAVSPNPSRLTVPPGGGGLYELIATASWVTTFAAARVATYIFKNGSQIAGNDNGVTGTNPVIQCIFQDIAVPGDFYEMKVYQNSGLSVNQNTTLAGPSFIASRLQKD